MINLVLDNNCVNKKQIVYTFYYLLKGYNERLNVSYKPDKDAINIFYGVEPELEKGIYIPAEHYDNKNIVINNYDELKYVSYNRVSFPYFEENKIIKFTFDILNISFFLISCGEEYLKAERDSKNRFLAEFSLRRNSITTPFFDLNSELIYKAMKTINNDIKKSDKKFEVFLTHDVDSVNSQNIYVLLHNVKELFVSKDKIISERIQQIFSDLCNNQHMQIDNYIDIEAKYNVCSEFYFITGRKHRLGKRYELGSIEKQINRLMKSSKHVIGLHTNFFSYNNEEDVKNDKREIERFTNIKVKSSRNHYLRFSVPNSWKVLRDSGICCDSTIGYSDKNGFRAGTVKAFLPYDVINNEIIDIYEVPLAVMDGIVMSENISFNNKWMKIKEIIDQGIKFNGTFSILWHDYVISNKEYKDMYIKILEYLIDNNAKFVLSHELDERRLSEKNDILELFGCI